MPSPITIFFVGAFQVGGGVADLTPDLIAMNPSPSKKRYAEISLFASSALLYGMALGDIGAVYLDAIKQVFGDLHQPVAVLRRFSSSRGIFRFVHVRNDDRTR